MCMFSSSCHVLYFKMSFVLSTEVVLDILKLTAECEMRTSRAQGILLLRAKFYITFSVEILFNVTLFLHTNK